MQGGAGLARRASSALAWSYSLTLIKALASFGFTTILARLLGPKPYGLIAAALLVVSFGSLVVEAGAGPSLIQRSSVTIDEMRAAASWQFVMGFVLTGFVAAISSSLARLFRDPAGSIELRVMSLYFLLQAPGMVSIAMLKRELRQRRILAVTTISYVAAYAAIGLPLAFTGFGVWSLVGAQLGQVTIASIFLFASRPYSVRWRAPWRDKQLLMFGSRVLMTNVLNWLIENGDNLLVGVFLGVSPLGLYSRAYATARLPANTTVQSLQSVTFSSVSRIANDGLAVRTAYLGLLNAVVLVSCCGFALLAALSRPIVSLLLGRAWLGSCSALAILCGAMIFQCVVAVTGPVLWSLNRVTSELRAQTLTILCGVPLIAALSGSILEFALAVLVIYGIRAFSMLSVLEAHLEVGTTRMLRSLCTGLRPASVILAGGAFIASHFPPVTAVLLASLLAVVVFGLIRVILPKTEITDELLEVIRLAGLQRLLSSGR